MKCPGIQELVPGGEEVVFGQVVFLVVRRGDCLVWALHRAVETPGRWRHGSSFEADGRQYRVREYVFGQLGVGELRSEERLVATCGNSFCINPAHLRREQMKQGGDDG